mmetsp:Transcript_7342/g.13907  ORF Transcript_7342/g.13907 Transcript_7342/m.13907 type:complete len:515 (+) Transcript_7342:186-1730(+)
MLYLTPTMKRSTSIALQSQLIIPFGGFSAKPTRGFLLVIGDHCLVHSFRCHCTLMCTHLLHLRLCLEILLLTDLGLNVHLVLHTLHPDHVRVLLLLFGDTVHLRLELLAFVGALLRRQRAQLHLLLNLSFTSHQHLVQQPPPRLLVPLVLLLSLAHVRVLGVLDEAVAVRRVLRLVLHLHQQVLAKPPRLVRQPQALLALAVLLLLRLDQRCLHKRKVLLSLLGQLRRSLLLHLDVQSKQLLAHLAVRRLLGLRLPPGLHLLRRPLLLHLLRLTIQLRRLLRAPLLIGRLLLRQHLDGLVLQLLAPLLVLQVPLLLLDALPLVHRVKLSLLLLLSFQTVLLLCQLQITLLHRVDDDFLHQLQPQRIASLTPGGVHSLLRLDFSLLLSLLVEGLGARHHLLAALVPRHLALLQLLLQIALFKVQLLRQPSTTCLQRAAGLLHKSLILFHDDIPLDHFVRSILPVRTFVHLRVHLHVVAEILVIILICAHLNDPCIRRRLLVCLKHVFRLGLLGRA